MKRKAFLCTALLTIAHFSLLLANASAGENRDEPGGEMRLLDKTGKVAGICALRHTDVKADISGFVARVNVTQEFVNPSKTPVEAIYSFPLPEDGAVDQMTMIVGDRRIVGRIKKKEEARKIYEAAKSAGKTASLLDQERPNIFTQAVANIMPGQKITVAISYVNILKYDEGGYEFSFPMTIGPRYIAAGHDAKDAQKISPPVAVKQRAGYDISMTVDIDAGVPLQNVESMLHKVNIQRSGTSMARISLADQAEIPNRDFILKYDTAGKELQTALLTHASKKGDGYFTLIFQPPLSPPQADVAPKEMIFVIDQTGSQSGWPIKKSKETMRYCIQRLNPGDTFQIIGFNTAIYPCFPKPVRATKENIEKALKFLKPIEGSGGTDILKSVQHALKMPDDPTRLRIVCYMTDGFIGNDMEVIDYIGKNRGRARMFPFGVGNSVNRFLIDQMARQGRGVAEYVTLGMSEDEMDQMWDREEGKGPENDAAARRVNSMSSSRNAAQRFYDRISQPVLLDPRVSWGGLPVADVYPNSIPDVFTAGPIVLKGRYTRGGEGDITLSGILRGKKWTHTLHVKFPEVQKEGSALPSLWAREKIAQLQSQDWKGAQDNNPNPQIKDQIVETALRYSLMSQYTSFVAVQQKIVNPGGASETVRVPIELGDGLNPEGFFGAEEGVVETAASNGGTGYRVAAGNTFAGQAGDPLITVQANADAREVIAILQGGEIKKLRFNPANRKWEARFDIPTYASEGNYVVTVIVVPRKGQRQFMKLHYKVDMTGPRGKAKMLAAGQSSVLLQIEGSDDTARVVAVLPWGARTVLKSTKSKIFTAQAAVPVAWRGKPFAATFVMTDNAHNRTTVSLDMSR